MTPAEFQQIETALQTLNPSEGIALSNIGPTNGNIKGTHPINWSADFSYAGGELTVHGHGMFGGKVESGIGQRLTDALTHIRSTASA
jgi:hypothetical protein